jgi:DEAD/DEAH box helicase domain-containing protein
VNRSHLDEVLDHLRSSSRKSRWITSWQILPGRQPKWAEFPASLHPDLVHALKSSGIKTLYKHQLDAFESVQKGRDTVIVTPTASGKTLCYNLPVLNALLGSESARALYIFPTKALGHDQLHELHRLTADFHRKIPAAAYDGDTPAAARPLIRKTIPLVLTNPDMLHTAMLPHHTKWQSLFAHLDTVVIDELHHYRGVFGSHLANIIRRMLRICAFYGSTPRFILCSATLANPRELASSVTGREIHLIDESGAPSGDRSFIFYNPPLVNLENWIRRSYLAESIEFARYFVENGVQTIVFARSRLNVEIILKELRGSLKNLAADTVRGYRGGYLSAERREIEAGLRAGSIRCVVATSALELGIDIGHLEAVVLAGYPGTIASTWQRAGRAGRRDERSVTVYVASAAPLDQFMVQNPAFFFESSPEHGLINPDNLLILLDHIKCAAFELPFYRDERFGNHPETADFLSFLEEEGEVIRTPDKWHFSGQTYPAGSVGLRSITSNQYKIVELIDGKSHLIAEMDEASVNYLLYPHAVYLHEDRQYVVEQLDTERLTVTVSHVETTYFTVPVEQSSVLILETFKTTDDLYPACFGELEVSSQVVGYKKLKFFTMEQVGGGTLDLPQNDLQTVGFWIRFAVDSAQLESKDQFKRTAAALSGVLTALHSVASVMLMSEPKDVGSCISGGRGQWSIQRSHLGSVDISVPEPLLDTHPEIEFYLYDRHPGGIGLTEELIRLFPDLIKASVKLVTECPCRFGCPACIGPVHEDNTVLKDRVLEYLRLIEGGIIGQSE